MKQKVTMTAASKKLSSVDIQRQLRHKNATKMAHNLKGMGNGSNDTNVIRKNSGPSRIKNCGHPSKKRFGILSVPKSLCARSAVDSTSASEAEDRWFDSSRAYHLYNSIIKFSGNLFKFKAETIFNRSNIQHILRIKNFFQRRSWAN